MSRDLAGEVIKLLGHSNAYIRKKVDIYYNINNFCCKKLILFFKNRPRYVQLELLEKYQNYWINSFQK